MAALGLDQVLNLAQQYGARDALEPRAPAVAVARGGVADQVVEAWGGTTEPEVRRLDKEGLAGQGSRNNLFLQSKCFNKTGHARTADHRLPSQQDLSRQSVAGKGKWKTWTPESDLARRLWAGNCNL